MPTSSSSCVGAITNYLAERELCTTRKREGASSWLLLMYWNCRFAIIVREWAESCTGMNGHVIDTISSSPSNQFLKCRFLDSWNDKIEAWTADYEVNKVSGCLYCGSVVVVVLCGFGFLMLEISCSFLCSLVWPKTGDTGDAGLRIMWLRAPKAR